MIRKNPVHQTRKRYLEMIIVSACLLGLKYRYDGSSNINSELLNLLRGKLIKPVCPETDGGLTVPRSPVEITGGDGFDVLRGEAAVINNKGEDFSDYFINGALRILDQIGNPENIPFAILKSRSPSCGSKYIYTGEFNGNLKPGSGVGAALLKSRGIKIYSEEELEEIKKLI